MRPMMWYTVTRKTAILPWLLRPHCFLPLYVFCRKQLLVSYLRPSKIDGAKHAWAILALPLVKRLRQVWHKSELSSVATPVFAAGGCCCGASATTWVTLSASPKRLNFARDCYAELGAKVRCLLISSSWDRVIAKIEHTAKGSNPRYRPT